MKAVLWLVVSGISLASGYAHAANFKGTFHVTGNTTLMPNQNIFGAVVFDVGNATLDCAGNQVHISSLTKPLCAFANGIPQKCGIIVDHKDSVTIKNCNIVGNFEQGIFINGSTNVKVFDSTTAGVFDTGIWVGSSTTVELNRNTTVLGTTGVQMMNSIDVTLQELTSSANAYGVFQDNGHARYRSLSITENDVGLYGRSMRPVVMPDGTLALTEIGQFFPPWSYFTLNYYEGLVIQNSQIMLRGAIVEDNNQSGRSDKSGISLINVSRSSIWSVAARENLVCDLKVDATSQGNSWRGLALGVVCGAGAGTVIVTNF